MSSETDLRIKAFQVEETDEEYDLNVPPTSGQEYLRRVQLEAKNCPDVVVADLDMRHFAKKQTVKVNNDKGCLPAPQGYAPPMVWQQKQVADFSEIRLALARYKMRLKANGVPKKRYVKLPDSDNYIEWCQFCFGESKVIDKGINESNTNNQEGATTKSKVVMSKGMPPLLSIVTEMRQPLVEKVLDYHINWFAETGFTAEQGQWFYALLSNLEKPLAPETCSSIRTLVRQCANLRATLENKDDQRLIHLNLLICLVSRYFDQGDLADSGT